MSGGNQRYKSWITHRDDLIVTRINKVNSTWIPQFTKKSQAGSPDISYKIIINMAWEKLLSWIIYATCLSSWVSHFITNCWNGVLLEFSSWTITIFSKIWSVFSVFIPRCLAMPTRNPSSYSAVSSSIFFVLWFLNYNTLVRLYTEKTFKLQVNN